MIEVPIECFARFAAGGICGFFCVVIFALCHITLGSFFENPKPPTWRTGIPAAIITFFIMFFVSSFFVFV